VKKTFVRVFVIPGGESGANVFHNARRQSLPKKLDRSESLMRSSGGRCYGSWVVNSPTDELDLEIGNRGPATFLGRRQSAWLIA
jgi:hypothetical protein